MVKSSELFLLTNVDIIIFSSFLSTNKNALNLLSKFKYGIMAGRFMRTAGQDIFTDVDVIFIKFTTLFKIVPLIFIIIKKEFRIHGVKFQILGRHLLPQI